MSLGAVQGRDRFPLIVPTPQPACSVDSTRLGVNSVASSLGASVSPGCKVVKGFAVGSLLVAAILSLSPPALAETITRYRIEPARSHVSFFATSRFVDSPGTFHRYRGEIRVDREVLERSMVVVEVEAASIDTRNGRRDDHLRSEDFFWAARFPVVRFESNRAERTRDGLRLTGTLTLRGVARPLVVSLAVAESDGVVTARGEFTVKQSDHGIPYRGILNPIRDEVRISFDFLAIRDP